MERNSDAADKTKLIIRSIPAIGSLRVGNYEYMSRGLDRLRRVDLWAESGSFTDLLSKVGCFEMLGSFGTKWKAILQLDTHQTEIRGNGYEGGIGLGNNKKAYISFKSPLIRHPTGLLRIGEEVILLNYPKSLMTDGLRPTDEVVTAVLPERCIEMCIFPTEHYKWDECREVRVLTPETSPVFQPTDISDWCDEKCTSLLIAGLLGFGFF